MSTSHEIETTPDGKIRIKDLELFMGYDPSIDSDDDEDMKDYNSDKVKSIVSRTNKFIARGSRPKMVIEHEKDGKTSNPKAVGDIEKVWYKEIEGVSFVIGDVIMSKKSFDAYLATNAFPRRSAEIWKDDHLSEVALLGRDTPRRPLPDTSFTKFGDKVVFERPLNILSMALDNKTEFGENGVGGGLNTFVPTSGNPKGKKMAKKKNMIDEEDKDLNDGSPIVDEDDDEDNFEDEPAEMDADIDDNDELVAMSEDEDEDSEMTYMEEEEETELKGSKKKMKSQKFTKGTRAEKALFAQVAALTQANQTMERQLRLERFAKEIDSMIRDGYRCSKFRNQMVDELANSDKPQDKMMFWKSTMSRDLTGVPMLAQMTVQDNGGGGMSDRDASARAVVESKGDVDKFKALFAKYSNKN